MGRTEGGIVAIVPGNGSGFQVGDSVNVLINGVSGQTLRSIKI
ncbi:TRAM domain-containing protein [candidate division KSB1 bacterium]